MPSNRRRGPTRLSAEESKSLTHGDFWIPDVEREVYRRALGALNDAAIPYVVAGAYAIYEHTGIYRQTKDLDLFVEPAVVVPAARALRDAGFVMRLEELHWLAKAVAGEADFCSEGITKDIKAELTRHLAGDYSPRIRPKEAQDDGGLFGNIFAGDNGGKEYKARLPVDNRDD